jgi:hypothetical protein
MTEGRDHRERTRPRGPIGAFDRRNGCSRVKTVGTGRQAAIKKYRKALPSLCAKHGASIEEFKTLTARYSADVFNRRIVVTVRDRVGRCYIDEYVGIPARHIKVTDHLGRVRTKRGGVPRLRNVIQHSD